MIGKRRKSKDSDSVENQDADAQAAGLEHWSAPPGYIPEAFDDEGFDDLGPSWQNDEDDENWSGSELTDVFEVPEELKEAEIKTPLTRSTSSVTKRSVNAADQSRAKRVASPRSESAQSLKNISQTTQQGKSVPQGRGQDDPRVIKARQIAAKRAMAAEAQKKQKALAQKQQIQEMKRMQERKALASSRQAGGQQADGQQDSDEDEYLDQSEFVSEFEPEYQDEFDETFVYPDEKPGRIKKEGDRDLVKATLVGLGLLLVSGAAIFFNAYTALALIGIVSLVAVAELYQTMRSAGLRPAKLLGYVGTLAIPTAAFFRGEAAYPLIICLIVVFGALWYLVGADTERPVLNISLTVFAMLWVGGLAGFAGMMLKSDYQLGRQLLVATIVIVAISDTMAYLGGRTYGATPFHSASPNKTWEGTLTGFVAALVAGLILGVTMDSFGLQDAIFGKDFTAAIVFGITIGVLTPIGDLAQSLIKRDLGVKDMGFILPGHGGILDRVDGLLFALPGAYYVATLFELISIA